MSPSARAILVGVAVTVALSAAIGFAAGVAGAGPLPLAVWVGPVVLGLTVTTSLARVGGNRAERRVGDAERAAALTPAPGRALIVVMRQGFAGKALGVDVAVDGRSAVQLRSPRASAIRVAPGAHTVAAQLPGPAGGAGGEPLRVEVAAGEVAVVTVRMVLGMTRNTVAVERAADPAAARSALWSMALVEPEPGAAAAAA